MIRGQFETKTGLIKVEIPDVGTTETVEISDLSTIKYEFDLIPDSPDVDSVQALYNKVDIEIFQFSDSQVDLYDRLLGQLIGGNALPVNLFLDSDQFGFFIEINDIKLNEIDRTITLKSRVRYNSTATVLSVFDDIETADPTKLKTFRPDPDVSVEEVEELDCVGVADWIAQGMKSVFTNDFTSIVRSAPTSSPQNYNQFNYTFLPDAPLGDTVGLIMARLTSPPFNGFEESIIGDGTIKYIPDRKWSGQNFNKLKVGDKITVIIETSGGIDAFIGIIEQIVSDTELITETEPLQTIKDAGSVIWSYEVSNSTGDLLAVDSLKELAAIEGSIFGTGFSRNFYVNRIQEQDVVTIDWDEVTENDIEPFFNPIGKAENQQLASTIKDIEANKDNPENGLNVGVDNFGIWPTSEGNWQVPKIVSGISSLKPIPGNNEEVNLRLAPGYPFLNKAISRVLINRYDGEYSAPESWNIDFEPILALCRTGLRSYVRSLSSDGRGIVIDFTAFKARSVKPWNLVQFVNAPDKYMGKLFRPTTIDYDVVRDLVSIKAYELVDADIPEPDLSIEVSGQSESNGEVDTAVIKVVEVTGESDSSGNISYVFETTAFVQALGESASEGEVTNVKTGLVSASGESSSGGTVNETKIGNVSANGTSTSQGTITERVVKVVSASGGSESAGSASTQKFITEFVSASGESSSSGSSAQLAAKTVSASGGSESAGSATTSKIVPTSPDPTDVTLIVSGGFGDANVSWTTPTKGNPDSYTIQYRINGGALNNLITGLSGTLNTYDFDDCSLGSSGDNLQMIVLALYSGETGSGTSNTEELSGCF